MIDGRIPAVIPAGGEGGGHARAIMVCFTDAIPGSKGVKT